MRIRSLSWFIKQCWFETNKCKSSQKEALIDAWLALELQRLSSCTLFSGRLWFVYWAIRRFTDNLFSLGHAWLSLWSENMITGRINQFARFDFRKSTGTFLSSRLAVLLLMRFLHATKAILPRHLSMRFCFCLKSNVERSWFVASGFRASSAGTACLHTE